MKRNKVSIGTYLYWSKNLASMLYSKLLLYLVLGTVLLLFQKVNIAIPQIMRKIK